MRKEKILEILENAKDGNGAVPMRLVRTAFDKLPEPCEDTISRRAAIDAINSWRGRFSEEYNEAIDDCENSIKELPIIQPEPKEGHWIDKGWNGDWAWQIDGRGNCWRVIECSECGKSVLVESNYCPHCGAKMRGEQHETD